MAVFLTGLVGGLMGSAHCVGMCGGFAAALGASELPLRQVIGRHAIYNVGRAFTYVTLGALAGSAGIYLSQHLGSLLGVQRVCSFIAGVAMLLVGLSALGWLRFKWAATVGVGNLLAPMFRQCLNARSAPGFFAAGMANGFLPCGLVFAFLALAVSQEDVVRGMVLMAGFGLGTIPAMLAIGCGARLVGHAMRNKVLRLAACFVVVIGVTTIYRATAAPGESCHGAQQAGEPACSEHDHK